MAKGVIYVMTTILPGLIKIGKTTKDNFGDRMYNLEHNGYANVTGLKRNFAIEVDDYDEKELLLHEIFSKSRVPNTELFALDIDLVVQLLSSLDGLQIYPEDQSKEEVFQNATNDLTDKNGASKVPDGKYYLKTTRKGFGKITASMRVESGTFIVEKGSICAPPKGDHIPERLKSANIKDNILQEDIACSSPSIAGWIVIGNNNNGWAYWKTADGKPIDVFRQDENR